MDNKPHWLTDKEIKDELQNCEIMFGVCGLNKKWYFSDRELEGVNGPYDSYHECVEACLKHLVDDPHWLSDREMEIVPETPEHVSQTSLMFWNSKWYFWDETYSRLKGPYPMKEDAQDAQEKYEDTL